jgi:hypothetical protein
MSVPAGYHPNDHTKITCAARKVRVCQSCGKWVSLVVGFEHPTKPDMWVCRTCEGQWYIRNGGLPRHFVFDCDE